MYGFWVVEEAKGSKEFMWWFQLDPEKHLDEIADRLDRVSRTAQSFWKETPPSQEEKEILLKLLRAVRNERTRILLLDILV